MSFTNRRQILKLFAQGGAVTSLFPASVARALAIPAARTAGTIRDVGHIVILMMENRSFDHYFGTLKGVRGFMDRHPVPLTSGKPVWFQSDGEKEIPPYHHDTKTTSAMRAPVTPHSFADAQAAWNQGKFGFWPKHKTAYAMGYYTRDDLPFQFALAEAFTLCDAYYCQVTTGTDPNRIAFWSGANFDPRLRAQGVNCTDADSEPDNQRCWIRGRLPEPGYTYQGSALTWPTIPEVLQDSGITWRIYQDPNDNWTGAMHGGLAFAGFRGAKPGLALYEKGMRHWSLEQLAEDVKAGMLPQVSWVLPPALWSEHPAPSSPAQGAEFTARVLDAITVNPEVWSKTVFFLTFDENDGRFDHVPPPAPPSYNADGTLAGKATLDLNGMYFSDPERRHLVADDTVSGTLRPWGLGPRVPMYVISPWSKGGWVNSQVFDHSSVGQFLEKRFGIIIPAISPWHRAVCGDLTSAFNFENPNDPVVPRLPDTRGSAAVVAELSTAPEPLPPVRPEKLFQEPGVRLSRALPYALHVDALREHSSMGIALTFRNTGRVGAVFHVYDKLHLERIPRRYTVEAGRELMDTWTAVDGKYDLWVYGPNGFIREFRGALNLHDPASVLRYEVGNRALRVTIDNNAAITCTLVLRPNAYGEPSSTILRLKPHSSIVRKLSLGKTANWYDFTLASEDGALFVRRFAGRMETGEHGVSDPAISA